MSTWRKLKIKPDELRLETTLQAGQAFRWKYLGDEWSCAFNKIIISLKQDASHIYYRVIGEKSDFMSHEEQVAFLKNYFNLSVCLRDLYKEWAYKDANFKFQMKRFRGVRILRQDPWENLICFICSSNNNIRRITKMIDILCSKYGSFVGTIKNIDYFNFPTPERLSESSVESELRELGFGYRAKFIQRTAWVIKNERPQQWLESLRNKSYIEAKKSLCELMGVGYKVADCVCLMSLDKSLAVPIDTHVWQIAQRDYNFKSEKYKTINKVLYDKIGNYFRNLWGEYAGWAQCVLFTSDLSNFKNRTIEMEMKLPKITFHDKINHSNELYNID
ncbi:hypothetical protein PORY_000828 [Pneumocystis oryctolagi]|uniref:Uncharacterized protein n=1 Tax=Pneumocystis oryctolagi TaxID=42067 RepID=A0ACB7CG08_9ASCO|nr:hypothetical protein PORY_000828 [Pneumocystis oryctolagi]